MLDRTLTALNTALSLIVLKLYVIMSNAICIERICKRYGRLAALDDVSFDVAEGELFGLIGPDGAGKSSLYRILTTLMLPNSGRTSVLGLDVVRDYRRLRTQIGYMPEKFSLYPDMTVAENMQFFASLFGVDIKDNFELIAPIYNPQLSKFPNRRAGALSGGMKQKLALCCALIHRPRILLLDEPTTGVDAVSRSEFWDMLRQLKTKGITIMVSTSYMDEAQLCERIALINEGKILMTDTPERLVASLDETIYAISAKEMFTLLEKLRAMPQVIDCYTFGASLHVVVNQNFDPEKAAAILQSEGLHDVRIVAAKGDIEDLFIKLMRK